MSEYVFHCYAEDCPREEALPPEQRHVLTPVAIMHTPAEVTEWLEWFVVASYGTDSADASGDMEYWREEWLRQAECGSHDIVLSLGDPRTVTVVPVVHPAQDMHWHIYQEEIPFPQRWTTEERRRQVPKLMFSNPAEAAYYLGRISAIFLEVDHDEYFEANGEEIDFWENQLVTMRRVFAFSQGPDFHITIDTFDGPDCHLCRESGS